MCSDCRWVNRRMWYVKMCAASSASCEGSILPADSSFSSWMEQSPKTPSREQVSSAARHPGESWSGLSVIPETASLHPCIPLATPLTVIRRLDMLTNGAQTAGWDQFLVTDAVVLGLNYMDMVGKSFFCITSALGATCFDHTHLWPHVAVRQRNE